MQVAEAGAAADEAAAVTGFQLARSVAGEAARPAVGAAVVAGLAAHAGEVLAAVQWALAQPVRGKYDAFGLIWFWTIYFD